MIILTKQGVVENGLEQARGTGFPTANIAYTEAGISGTYAGTVQVGERRYQAAVYANAPRGLLEAHLFDFSGNLYGQEIMVTLLEQVAKTVEFRDSDDEQAFIKRVVAEVRQYFNNEP